MENYSPARRRYAALAKESPDLMRNPAPDCIEIVLEADEIAAAETGSGQDLTQRGLPKAFAEVGVLHENEYFVVVRDAVRFPDDSLGTYVRILMREEVCPGAVILPVLNHKVVLLKHFRHATREWHWEIPRGFATKGLSPAENARKELREEIGASALRLEAMGLMHVNTGLTSEVAELFLAEIDAVRNTDTHEGITDTRLVEPAVLEMMIRHNKITDSFTMAAFARARLKGLV